MGVQSAEDLAVLMRTDQCCSAFSAQGMASESRAMACCRQDTDAEADGVGGGCIHRALWGSRWVGAQHYVHLGLGFPAAQAA